MATCPIHGRVRKTSSSYEPATRPDGRPFQAFVVRHSCGGFEGIAEGTLSDLKEPVRGWHHHPRSNLLPDIPLPQASPEVRKRNARLKPKPGMSGERCIICDAPLAGRLIGLNYSNAKDTIMDPAKPLEPDSGVLWVGATCARKVPAGYRIPWKAT